VFLMVALDNSASVVMQSGKLTLPWTRQLERKHQWPRCSQSSTLHVLTLTAT
jgi:hypothetical protein